MIELIIFGAGMYCGHVVSPWVDEKLADLKQRFDPDYYDDPRADDRKDWRDL